MSLFSFLYDNVHTAVVRAARILNPNTAMSRYSATQAATLIGALVSALVAARTAATASADAARKAVADLEPLKAENMRINAVIGDLNTQVDKYEADDALTDAALAEAAVFLETPPDDEPPVETPPVETPPVETPPAGDVPTGNPPVDAPADVPAEVLGNGDAAANTDPAGQTPAVTADSLLD